MRNSYRNILLKRMDPQDLALMEPWLEPVDLKKLSILDPPGVPLQFVYFVENGVISVLSHLDERRDVELGVIGREGMTGISLVLRDDRSPFTVHVEMPGSALRLPADRFRAALEDSRRLHDFLLRYVRAHYLQLSSTAAANQRATLEERLARWILMGIDRVDGDRFHVTHDALAWLIGARRSGVTDTLHVLEGKGLIRSVRSELIVLDSQGLQEAASGSYGFAEREYARLVGEDFRSSKIKSHSWHVPELFLARTSPDE